MKTTLSLSGLAGNSIKIFKGEKMSVGRFPLAVRKQVFEEGAWKTVTSWHQVVLFGQWAESVRQLVGKGCRITVNGYNREKTYNGKLYREIVATSLSFSC